MSEPQEPPAQASFEFGLIGLFALIGPADSTPEIHAMMLRRMRAFEQILVREAETGSTYWLDEALTSFETTQRQRLATEDEMFAQETSMFTEDDRAEHVEAPGADRQRFGELQRSYRLKLLESQMEYLRALQAGNDLAHRVGHGGKTTLGLLLQILRQHADYSPHNNRVLAAELLQHGLVLAQERGLLP